MTTYAVSQRRRETAASPLVQALLALAGGVVLFGFLLLALLLVYDIRYAGRIYPGVTMAGIDLSGLSSAEAAARLSETIQYPAAGQVIFKDNFKSWTATPAELGFALDAEGSARYAYHLGRSNWPWTRLADKFVAWYWGMDLPPLFIYDERAAHQYLETIAAQVNQPMVEAALAINGLDVVVTPGQVGRMLDIPATLAPLEVQLRTLTDAAFPLVIQESRPAILDASQQAQIARQIISAPLTLRVPDAQPGETAGWQYEPARLVELLAIERVEKPEGMQYQVGIQTDKLRAILGNLAPALARNPSNGRFTLNEQTRQLEAIVAPVTGRALDVDASMKVVNEKLAQGEHTIDLAVAYTDPQIGASASAESLGIRELVSEQTSYFYGSSAARIQNIKTAASRFHGVLVAPGETFSMASVMGDVSLDTGYAEALIIYGNRTIKGVGGGVCQVSTTLFRTVFFGGFPVVERHSHAYRVTYYELNAAGAADARMAGLDATVFVPVVDFKFKNDTPYWLLMETYVSAKARTITWKFYSTSDGRSVEWQTSGLQNKVDPPEPTYVENPALAQGEINQVDWAVEGADVTVNRVVYRGGQVYFQDQFTTHYLPWASVFEYGPGTPLPTDQQPKKKR